MAEPGGEDEKKNVALIVAGVILVTGAATTQPSSGSVNITNLLLMVLGTMSMVKVLVDMVSGRGSFLTVGTYHVLMKFRGKEVGWSLS